MAFKLILTKWKSIPKEVQLFLVNAMLLFIIWQLLYGLFLYQSRLLDDFLTQLTGIATENILQVLYTDKSFYSEYFLTSRSSEGHEIIMGNSLVWMGAQPLIRIADSCNGLKMYALFLGFILAYPAKVKLKCGFGLFGLIALIGVNVTRCVGLAILQIHHPSFMIFAHHYIFNVLTYMAVCVFWYWFTKKASS